jgi:hypothetical protein
MRRVVTGDAQLMKEVARFPGALLALLSVFLKAQQTAQQTT